MLFNTLVLNLSLILLFSSNIAADTCVQQKQIFEKEEKAYDNVIRVKIASQERKAIIDRFIEAANGMLNECPKTISLDRQYTLQRKVKKAKVTQSKLNVMTLEELRKYAITTPEKRVIYRNGTVTLH